MISVVAAQKTHAILLMSGFQPGETSSIPDTCVPHAPETLSASTAFVLLRRTVRADVALPAKNRSA